MTEILFIKTSSLGDVVHQLPAITDAARANPGARLSWVVEEAYAPLARLHPAISEVIPVATRRWRKQLGQTQTWREVRTSIRSIRAMTYDAIVDTQGILRSAVIAQVARGRRHGYDSRSIREPLASRLYDETYRVGWDQHPIARNRILTSRALGYDLEGDIDYGLDPDALRNASAGDYAVLLHGTADRRKEWPERDWIAVGRHLASCGHDIVLPWGTSEERTRSDRLANAIPNATVPARKPLDAVAMLIGSAQCVIGVDTGLLHLAAALGIPRVGLFGAVAPVPAAPLGSGPMTIAGAKGHPPTADAVIAAYQAMRAQASRAGAPDSRP